MYRNQKQLRAAFWQTFPELSRRRIPNYSGDGTMYINDTRCAWSNWLDALQKSGEITDALADRATLD